MKTDPKDRVADLVGDRTVSPVLQEQLLSLAHEQEEGIWGLILAAPYFGAVASSRTFNAWGAGQGYYSQVWVFYQGQRQFQEWCWRDPYTADNDHFELRVRDLGIVEIVSESDGVKVRVEINPGQSNSRWAEFTFQSASAVNQVANVRLSKDEQAAFVERVEAERADLLADMMRRWQHASAPYPIDVPGYRHTSTARLQSYRYSQPEIKQMVMRLELGLAAFVTERQIDQEISVPEMQNELWVLTNAVSARVRVMEKHAYIRQAQVQLSISIAVIELTADGVLVEVGGKQELVPLPSAS